MTETLKLTRRGWIEHLATIQEMVALMWELYETPTYRSVMGPKNCEDDRRKKIAKKWLELRELIWETSAVSEKILREEAKKKGVAIEELEGLCGEPWSEEDRKNEYETRARFEKAAKDLEARIRSLWDPTAPEMVEPEVVYPGGEGKDATQPPEGEEEDPRQQTFDVIVAGAGRREPPVVDPRHLVDYKMQQANDDTNTPDKPEEDE
jgi:hypothetical protein